MNSPFLLFQLQRIDSRLALVDNRLKEIKRILNHDPALIAAKNEMQLSTTELADSSEALQTIELKIQDKRNKLEQSESSLYGGKIRNPKELQDLQKEIASIKTSIGTLEDDQINLMLVVEEKENRVHVAQQKLSDAEKSNMQTQVDLEEESIALNLEKSKLVTERDFLTGQVPASLLQKYNDLRSRKGGCAVARVEDQTCSLCGARLTPSECQSAKSPSILFFCPTCGRILYAD
jgi:hypothetical protein